MKLQNLVFIIVAAILFSACSSGKKKEQTISLSGAFALYPMAVKWSEEYQKEHPEIKFNISAGGAGKGVADALSGAVDLGMLSRAVEKQEINNGLWFVAVTKDAVIPTINVGNPVLETLKKRGLTQDEFRKIYINGEITNWNQLPGITNDLAVNVYTRSDACGAAATWAEYIGGKQEDLKGTGIFGDPGLAEAVVKDVNGVGFNNTIFLYDLKSGGKNPGIDVIPNDVNGNGTIDPEEAFYDQFTQVLAAIGEGKYPSPPARDLYFVAKGKPQKQAVTDFLNWVITKGQAFVPEAGYVPLTEATLQEQVAKLK